MREGLSRPLWLAVIAVAFALPLFVGLGSRDLENDEAIYSYAVDSVLERGDWLNPILSPFETTRFLEKPPLKFWIVGAPIATGLLPHDERGFRAWDALFGGIAFLYVFALGRRLAGAVCGLVAVFVLFVYHPLLFEHGLRDNAMLLVLCGGPLLFLRTNVVDALKRRGAFVFYLGATIILGLLCCGPVLRTGEAVILGPMPYRWLMAVPGFDQLRVPTRFWMLGTLCLGVAAGVAFARLSPNHGRRRAVAVLLLSVGLTLDGWTKGIAMADAPQQWPRVERRGDTRPILELPLGPDWDAAATFRSMRHRRPVLNGVSGYDPPHYEPLKSGLGSHDPALLLAIASLGEFEVVVNGDADRDGAWARYVASVPGAIARETDGKRTVYRIPGTPRTETRLGPIVPIVGARANSLDGSLAVDGRMDTEWNDGRSQQPGQWLIADLGQPREVAGITHALGEFARDFPRRLVIDTSLDGSTWVPAWEGPTVVEAFLAATRAPIEARMPFAFEPRQARFVRLRQLDIEIHLWRVAELTVHGTVDSR